MKKLFFTIVLALVSTFSFAQSHVWVNGHTRSNGSQVTGHYRTSQDYTKNNNWSTIGNVNPYTGKAGTLPGDSGYKTYTSSSSYSTYKTPTYTTPTYTTPVYSTPVYTTPVYSTPVYSTPVYKTRTTYYRYR
jgi:hypothetical protein